jgi:hypothetical protein
MKFLSPKKLENALSQIAALARTERVRVVLIGGYALQFYGSDRLTGDVDIAANKPVLALPQGKPLSFGGAQTKAPNGVPVDFVLRSDVYAPLYRAAIGQAHEYRGAPILIATAEFLAAMKMAAGRTKDMADLEFLLSSSVLDVPATRRIVHRYLGPYAVDEFNRLVDEAAWKASRGT